MEVAEGRGYPLALKKEGRRRKRKGERGREREGKEEGTGGREEGREGGRGRERKGEEERASK